MRLAAIILLFLVIPLTSALVVTNLQPVSYDTALLNEGDQYYVDRSFTLTNVPSAYAGRLWIRTANDDKQLSTDPLITFDIDEAARVTVGLDTRVSEPSWLSGWTPTGEQIRTSDGSGGVYNLYTADLPAGTITLGPNAGGVSSSMYLVLLEAQQRRGDVNGDNKVDLQDLLVVISAYGQPATDARDQNGDGMINLFDLVRIGTYWGSAASPAPLQAGSASASAGDSWVTLSATTPTGGTTPYTYQWYRATTPSKGSAVAAATSRAYTDSAVTNDQTYYYTLTATDSDGTSIDYPRVSATPKEASATGGVLYAEDFEGGVLGDRISLYSPAGTTFSWGVSGNVAFSDEVSRSGSQSLRFHVPQGVQYNNEGRFSLGQQVAPRLWIEYYLYFPDGTEGIPNVARYAHGDDPDGGDNDKFIRVWGEEYTHSMGLHTEPIGPADEDAKIHMAWDPNDGVAGYYHPDGYNAFQRPFIVGDADRGRWVQVRQEYRIDTLGTATDGMFEGNGGLRLWKDGALVNEMLVANVDEAAAPYWAQGYLLGAANSGSPVDTAIYMDDLKFYTSDPGWDAPAATTITGISFDAATHQQAAPGSDNWAMTWADDDHQYTNWGDGGGFGGTNSIGRVLMGAARIEGTKDAYTGINVNGGYGPESGNTAWPAAGEWGKSRTMLYVDGALYLLASRYSFGSDCGVTICAYERQQLWKSTDYGATWSMVPGMAWNYGNGETFGFHHFINMGRAYQDAIDGYVYVSAIEIQDPTATQIQAPGELILMRAPRSQIEDKAAYEYFSGTPASPAWSTNPADRAPVLTDPEGFMRHSITYIPALDRFLMLGPHTADDTGNLKVWEAPKPWGPWSLVREYREDDGTAWNLPGQPQQWYFWDVAPKWIGPDGTSIVVVATGKQSADSWNTVEATLTTS